MIPYIKLPREPHGIFTLYDDDIDADPQPFDMYAKITQPVPRRRHSITDPCKLTARFRKLRESTELISFMRRRNSDPTLYKPMHPTERRSLPYVRLPTHSCMHAITLAFTLTYSLTHTHSHSLTYSLLLTHSLTLTHPLTHFYSFSLTHSLTLGTS